MEGSPPSRMVPVPMPALLPAAPGQALPMNHPNPEHTPAAAYMPKASGLGPTMEEARLAHIDISELLRPRCRNGKPGHLPFKEGDDQLYLRMSQIKMLLWLFSCPDAARRRTWIAASEEVAFLHQGGPSLAKTLRKRAQAFIHDRHDLPFEMRGIDSKHSLLDNDELREKVVAHLVSVGKYVRALDIVELLARNEVQVEFGLKKTIGLSTAQGWMHELGYRWAKTPTGQFVDGHERSDVVKYRQEVFLPRMEKLSQNVPCYSSVDGSLLTAEALRSSGQAAAPTAAISVTPSNTVAPSVSSAAGAAVSVSGPAIPVEPQLESLPAPPDGQPHPQKLSAFLFHDESIFYAHDRREMRWVAPGEKATPRKKGEGHSLMVADFIGAEFGFLQSKDGKHSARVIFRSGKNRDGYFTNADILDQLTIAMDICETDYPEYEITFVLDNATTHLKRADDALSARHMTKNITLPGNPVFRVLTNVIGADGKPVHGPDGKILKTKIHMADAKFADGTPQALYYPDNPAHPHSGLFKGMVTILEERGFTDVARLRAECPKFKCPPGAVRCCCRRLLFEQPDFRDVKSLVETHCEARGFKAIFLPKFHCELNPIEQCWCVAKRTYREFPPSSAEADLERNVLASLDSVTLTQIRR